MTNAVLEAQRHGQAIWMDYISREMLISGELERLALQGISGVTSNPSIFEKAIASGTDYDRDIKSLARRNTGVKEAYEALALADIATAADLLRPTYDMTDGRDGFVSLEVSPALARDTMGTVEEARRLFAFLERPNVMIKVPATPEGMPAIRTLISEGINVNATLIFSLNAYNQVREAYLAGLEDRARAGNDVTRTASVASFFVSRVDTAVDALLQERTKQGKATLQGLLGKAAVANARLAYQDFLALVRSPRFQELRRLGAQVQRPLWASTSTKNPAYSDLLYVEPLIGMHTVNTMPPATLSALLDHGRVAPTLEQGVDEARAVMAGLDAAGVSMAQVTDKLLAEGVKAFADSFDKLLANLEQKLAAFQARPVPTAAA
ncbi:MAG: transaldolase [Chloroflexi bacterium]|nr:transaldolase [Chloroflexota bacterium]